MSRLAVAEEGLVVDPRLQALEVEPARGLGRQRPARRTGRSFALVLVRPVALVAVAALAFAIFRAGMAVGILVATIVIAIERHLVEARVVIGIPSIARLPRIIRAIAEASRRRFAAAPRVHTPPNTPGMDPLAYARHPAARRTVRGIIAGSAKTVNIKHT